MDGRGGGIQVLPPIPLLPLLLLGGAAWMLVEGALRGAEAARAMPGCVAMAGGGGPAGPRTVRGTEAARVRAGSRPAAGSGPANTFSGLMSRWTKPCGNGGGEAKARSSGCGLTRAWRPRAGNPHPHRAHMRPASTTLPSHFNTITPR